LPDDTWWLPLTSIPVFQLAALRPVHRLFVLWVWWLREELHGFSTAAPVAAVG
jgi:hypothetical protein